MMTPSTPRTLRRALRDGGFTLTELLVVVSLLTIVVLAGWTLLDAATTIADQVDAKARVAEETRMAMDRLTTELRQAAELPGMEGAGVFSEISTGTAAFYADVDHDGQLELVAYRRSGPRMTRSVTQPTFVNGFPRYGTAGAAQTVIFGLPSDWSEPIFTFWSRGNPPGSTVGTLTAVKLTQAEAASVSAVSVRLRNSVKVGRRTAYTDLETWIKLRSVQNSVN